MSDNELPQPAPKEAETSSSSQTSLTQQQDIGKPSWQVALDIAAAETKQLFREGGHREKNAIQQGYAAIDEVLSYLERGADQEILRDAAAGHIGKLIIDAIEANTRAVESQQAAEIARLEARIAELEAKTQRERADAAETKATEAEKKSRENPVTHLPNLLALKEELPIVLANASRESKPVSVLYVDVDGLSLVNGAHGHKAGDDLLITFGDLAKRVIRDGDRLYHPHGDEFSIVLPNADSEEAAQVAQRIVDAAKTNLLPTLQSHGYMQHRSDILSATVGISSAANGTGDPELLIKQADTAMFNAKQQGKESGEKGKILIFEEGMQSPKYERND